MGLFSKKGDNDAKLRQALELDKQNKYKKAGKMFLELAEDGVQTAQAMVSKYYITGSDSIPKDAKEALFWMQRAADSGMHGMSEKTLEYMYELGSYYRDGIGTGRDMNKAIECFNIVLNSEQTSDRVRGFAKRDFAKLYIEGIWVKKDIERATEILRDMGRDKNHDACCYFAMIFLQEYGEREKAIDWLTLSEFKNFSPAAAQDAYKLARQLDEDIFILAMRYIKGDGRQQNGEKALVLLEWLIGWGQSKYHINALYEAAKLYYKGDLVMVNYIKAKKYFNILAENDVPEGCYFLGMIADEQEHNRRAALEWFRRAKQLEGQEDEIEE